MLKRLHILIAAMILTLTAVGQNLPTVCQGSTERYWVKGDNGISTFEWKIYYIDNASKDTIYVPQTAIKPVNAGSDTVDVSWNFPNMQSGTYTFMIKQHAKGCTSEWYDQDIMVNTPTIYVPISSFTNVTDNLINLCENGTFELQIAGTGGHTLNPTLSKWVDINQNISKNRIISSAGTFTLQVIDDMSSCSFDTVKVVSQSLPKVNLGDDISICNNTNATINSTVDKGNYYTWYFDGSETGSTGSSFTVEKPGTVVLAVKDDYGCVGSDTLQVSGCDPRSIRIPAAFTPNNDGINDEWYIPDINFDWVFSKPVNNSTPQAGKITVEDLKIEIYSRWGKRVYNLKTDRKAWDGTDESGKPLPVDSYHYIVRFKVNGETILLKGPVTILL